MFWLQKELCQEWDKKKDSEKKYAEFYRAVHAVAFSTGTKLKTRVQVLNKVFTVFNFNIVHYDIRSNATKKHWL